MTDELVIFASLRPGSSRSWLRLLAEGWRFDGLVVEPMLGHHGRYSVLMVRAA